MFQFPETQMFHISRIVASHFHSVRGVVVASIPTVKQIETYITCTIFISFISQNMKVNMIYTCSSSHNITKSDSE